MFNGDIYCSHVEFFRFFLKKGKIIKTKKAGPKITVIIVINVKFPLTNSDAHIECIHKI